MNALSLTPAERQQIDEGPWFSRLSDALRADILDRASVRRHADGALLSCRGEPAQEWCGVAKGAVRVSSVSLAGKQVSLTYVEPGTWLATSRCSMATPAPTTPTRMAKPRS